MGVLGHWAGRGMKKMVPRGSWGQTWGACCHLAVRSDRAALGGGGEPRTPPGARVHGGLLDHEREDRRL